MVKTIDIRKVATPICEYYESVADFIPVTFTGRLKGITPEGHAMLLLRRPFCRLLRTLVKQLQAGQVPDKPALCQSFGLPARIYNTAKVAAEGLILSAIESQKVALEDVEIDINRQVVEAFNGPYQEQPGRIGKLKRLYKQRKKLLAQLGRPHIHFGRRFYHEQETAGWKKAYDDARNDRIGCLGSADETAGNSTFQLKTVYIGDKPVFNLFHAGKLMGQVALKPKERAQLEAIQALNCQPFTCSKEVGKQGKNKGKLVSRKVSTGRVPLTIWLIHKENGHWYVHVSFLKDGTKPDYTPVGAIGVDLNCDSIADTRVQIADGAPLVLRHEKRMFDPSWSKEEKEVWIHEQIREIVSEAKAQNYMVVLEYLDFEHCKRWLRTKLGAMLRVMPYKKIRKAFERKCMEQGVVLRYVKSNYTSLLGAVLTSYPNLGRDQAAAAIIGLRALDEGNAWLEKQCRILATREGTRLRINRKRKFGCTVNTEGVMMDRQLEDCPAKGGASLDRSADVHRFQRCAGRAISDLSKAMGAYLHRKKVVSLCWKRSGLATDPWHPVVPDAEAPRPKTKCSTLSRLV
jgi:IS605 OrfB family transposase